MITPLHEDPRNTLRPPAAAGVGSSRDVWDASAQLMGWLRSHPAGRILLRHRIWLLGISHAVIFTAAYWVAFGLRFDFAIPWEFQRKLVATLPLLLTTKLVVFYALGHFHGWWRYVTFSDLVALLKATVISLLMMVLFNHYLLEGMIPRVVVFLDAVITLLLLGSLRASWRLYREQLAFRWRDHRIALMMGADDRSVLTACQIQSHPELPFRIVGLLDHDESRCGSRMGGIPIVGSPQRLGELAATYRVTDVLTIADALTGRQLRQLMEDCDAANLTLKMVPSYLNHLNGDGPVPIRDVDIEDLLRREPVQLDQALISRELCGRTALVTGAGGSIGSEICRQLVQFGPRRLILVDHGENALFLIHHELTRGLAPVEIIPVVADILDEERMRQVFNQHRPEFVVHAAAHKHVGLMESNIAACARNNVLGTKVVADQAHAIGARKFVLISTDKAVNPTSVMGATKQIAERYINAIAQESTTAFIVVRFGNVLGSNGSVVPLFKEQIRRGGPITVTDERMTRFFMTIPEASQLVLQAAAMGRGGEIFVLEMGEQLSISDLARDLIRLSGLPSDAIEIRYVGIRPGEKLYEELYFSDEQSLSTPHSKVRAAYHRPYRVAEVLEAIRSLEPLVSGPDAVVRSQLQKIVPEFKTPQDAASPDRVSGAVPFVADQGVRFQTMPPAADLGDAGGYQPLASGHGPE